MFVFQKIWRALFSGNTHLEFRPFALASTSSSEPDFNLVQVLVQNLKFAKSKDPCRCWRCYI